MLLFFLKLNLRNTALPDDVGRSTGFSCDLSVLDRFRRTRFLRVAPMLSRFVTGSVGATGSCVAVFGRVTETTPKG
jgi:hypothetical protein